MSEKHVFKKQFDELRINYEVNHLYSDETKVVFILESPHIDELVHGAPVSGLSGGTMSKVLLGKEQKTPLGRLIKENLESGSYPLLHKAGIINICPIPMQLAAYTNKKVIEKFGGFEEKEYEEFFSVMEKVRTGTKRTYKDENRNIVQNIVLENFRELMATLKDKELTIIPCGKTAQTFFDLADVESENWEVLLGVPHPSYNSWNREKYQEIVKQIKNLF